MGSGQSLVTFQKPRKQAILQLSKTVIATAIQQLTYEITCNAYRIATDVV